MDLSFPDPIVLAIMLVIFYMAALVMICSLITYFVNTFSKSRRRLDVLRLMNQGFVGLKISLSLAALIWLIKIILFETINFGYTVHTYIDIFSVLFICIPMIVVSVIIGFDISKQYRR